MPLNRQQSACFYSRVSLHPRRAFPQKAKTISVKRACCLKVGCDSKGVVSKSVLAVEDNVINHRCMVRQLELRGYKCTVAENGYRAVRFWEEMDFDVIIMVRRRR
jgi:PleD family two-component response regulator